MTSNENKGKECESGSLKNLPQWFATFNFLERKEMTNLSSVHSSAPTVTVNTANDNNSSFSGALGGLFIGATLKHLKSTIQCEAFVKIKPKSSDLKWLAKKENKLDFNDI